MSTLPVSDQSTRAPLRIGEWLVDPDRLRIHGPSGDQSLEPRVMELLLYLADRPRQVISAEQLLIDIWRGSFYGDGPVQRAMALLRRSLGDQAQTPRYIETIRKRGYRLIAEVVLPTDYAATPRQTDNHWINGSPFVGLRAFAAEHSGVFFGRGRATAAVLEALRAQHSNGSGLVLLLGASGSGKTSLLQAGVLPLVCRTQGFDQLRVLSCAVADFSGGPANPLSHLASALCTWTLHDRAVFQHRDAVTDNLREDPRALLTTLDHALQRWPTPHRQADGLMLLVLDHCEALLNPPHADTANLNLAVDTLASHPRVLVLVVCRSDFYPELLARLPVVAERKLPDGHVDLLPPSAGELADVIRKPALAAGLRFEQDPATGIGLDDALRDAAIVHPEALPMLQYTLQALYEQREGHWLRYAAYRSMGGLEGALAQHAEAVFRQLPASAQHAFAPLLQRLVVSHESQRALTSRRLPRSALQSPAERELVDQLVAGRLLTSTLIDDQAHVAITHESLLRAWPRVVQWAQENERQLRTRERIEQATERWLQADRRADLLLTRGMPLAEARELLEQAPGLLDVDQQALVRASIKADHQRRRRLWYALAGATLLALTSIVLAIREVQARADADRQRAQAEQLIDFLLTDLADALRPIGRLALMDKVAQRALDQLGQMPDQAGDHTSRLQRARALRTLGEVFFGRGDQSAAERAWLQAEQSLAGLPDSEPAVSLERGTVAFWLGNQAFQLNRLEVAQQRLEQYRALMGGLVARDPDNKDWQLELSYAQNSLGSLAQKQNRNIDALRLFEESATIKASILKTQPDNTALAAELADSWSWIGSALEQIGRLREAENYYERQLHLLRQVSEREPGADGWRHRMALAELITGNLVWALGHVDKGRELFGKAEATLAQLVASDATNSGWKRDWSFAQLQLAYWYLRQSQPKSAQKLLEQADARMQSILGRDASMDLRQLAAWVQLRLSQTLHLVETRERAQQALERASVSAQILISEDPNDPLNRTLIASVHLVRGDWMREKSINVAKVHWSLAQGWLTPPDASTYWARWPIWVAVQNRLGVQDANQYIGQLRAMGYQLDPTDMP